MKSTKIYTEDKRANKVINYFINKLSERLLGVGVEVEPTGFFRESFNDGDLYVVEFTAYDPFTNEVDYKRARLYLNKDGRKRPLFYTFC